MEIKMEPKQTPKLDIGSFFYTEDDVLFFIVEDDSGDDTEYPIKIVDMKNCTVFYSFESIQALRKHYEESIYTIYSHKDAELKLR